MCQTAVISRHIGRIGRRSFDRRMRIASPLFVEKRGEVARLLNDVDRLSDRLHADLRPYDDRMRQQIADLEELDHDIVEFRIKAPKNKELQEVMAKIGKMDFSKLSL